MKEKMDIITYKFFSVFTILSMIWAISTTIFSPRIGKIFSLFRDIHSYKIIISINLLCLLFTILLFYFMKRVLLKKSNVKTLSDRHTYIILAIELIVYFCGLLLFLKFIGFNQPVDDTAITLKFLEQLQQGTDWGYNYMYSNPQNLLLMYIFSFIQSIFGKNYQVIIVIFSLIHISTIIFTFFSLKNLNLKNTTSLLTIQIFIFAIQVTLHAPVAYTDILSLFFISLSLFFFTKYIRVLEQKEPKNWQNLLFACLFSVIGFLSKGTVLILIIALFVMLFLTKKKKKKLLAFLPLLFLLIGNMAFKQYIIAQNIFPDNNFGQPNSHYIMMGLNNTPIPDTLSKQQAHTWVVGAYSRSEQQYTWDLYLDKRLPKKQIEKKHFKIIKQRWNNMSFKQKIESLNNKVSVTWGSGDLKTSFEMFLGTGRKEDKMWVFKNKLSGLFIYSIMMIIQYSIYLGIILAAIKFFNSLDPFIYFSTIYITGYFTFLLIWESSPRYSMGIFIFGLLMIGKFLESNRLKDLSLKTDTA